MNFLFFKHFIYLKELYSHLYYSIIHASDQPTTPNATNTDYGDDKVIFLIYNDPIIASANLRSRVNLQSEWNEK